MHNLMHPLPGIVQVSFGSIRGGGDNEYSCQPSPSPERSTCMCTKSFGHHNCLSSMIVMWKVVIA